MNPGSLLITIVYTALLAWGASVGVRQIYQGFRAKDELLNPMFADPIAIRLFTVHIVVVSADLFLIAPLALANKSQLWYWGGRILLLSSSLPIATFFNRNPESFGKLIGKWVVSRNFFEFTLHVVVAAMAVNWFHYYVLVWWIVAYRYLDVGPRRLLQKLYGTPEKLAARPWAPKLNWAVIATLYFLSFLAVYHRQILWANVPDPDTAEHVARGFEVGVIVGLNVVLAMGMWLMSKRWMMSQIAAARARAEPMAWSAGSE